jgi:GDP-L-fucose synthase
MNILITGANGFIGSNIAVYLINNTKYNIFRGTRNTIDLLCQNSIENFIKNNKIDIIIHCAIEGGNRTKTDTSDVFYKNLLMYENLIKFRSKYLQLINIASGAEFDRLLPIDNVLEKEIFNRIPIDYYGLSKNIISKQMYNGNMGVNLRLFGCFDHTELDSRFIKANILNYIHKRPLIIHENKYIDYIYLPDLLNTIEYYLSTSILVADINLTYLKKYTLVDIANIINKLSTYKCKLDIKTDITKLGLSYTGNGYMWNNLNIPKKDIEHGIQNCYNKLKI